MVNTFHNAQTLFLAKKYHEAGKMFEQVLSKTAPFQQIEAPFPLDPTMTHEEVVNTFRKYQNPTEETLETEIPHVPVRVIPIKANFHKTTAGWVLTKTVQEVAADGSTVSKTIGFQTYQMTTTYEKSSTTSLADFPAEIQTVADFRIGMANLCFRGPRFLFPAETKAVDPLLWDFLSHKFQLLGLPPGHFMVAVTEQSCGKWTFEFRTTGGQSKSIDQEAFYFYAVELIGPYGSRPQVRFLAAKRPAKRKFIVQKTGQGFEKLLLSIIDGQSQEALRELLIALNLEPDNAFGSGNHYVVQPRRLSSLEPPSPEQPLSGPWSLVIGDIEAASGENRTPRMLSLTVEKQADLTYNFYLYQHLETAIPWTASNANQALQGQVYPLDFLCSAYPSNMDSAQNTVTPCALFFGKNAEGAWVCYEPNKQYAWGLSYLGYCQFQDSFYNSNGDNAEINPYAPAYLDLGYLMNPKSAWAAAKKGDVARIMGNSVLSIGAEKYLNALFGLATALNLRPDYPWARAHFAACFVNARFFEFRSGPTGGQGTLAVTTGGQRETQPEFKILDLGRQIRLAGDLLNEAIDGIDGDYFWATFFRGGNAALNFILKSPRPPAQKEPEIDISFDLLHGMADMLTAAVKQPDMFNNMVEPGNIILNSNMAVSTSLLQMSELALPESHEQHKLISHAGIFLEKARAVFTKGNLLQGVNQAAINFNQFLYYRQYAWKVLTLEKWQEDIQVLLPEAMTSLQLIFSKLNNMTYVTSLDNNVGFKAVGLMAAQLLLLCREQTDMKASFTTSWSNLVGQYKQELQAIHAGLSTLKSSSQWTSRQIELGLGNQPVEQNPEVRSWYGAGLNPQTMYQITVEP